MQEHKKHLNSCFGITLCGIEINIGTISLRFAQTYKEVTCKRCMKSWNYKMYMDGKFREKP